MPIEFPPSLFPKDHAHENLSASKLENSSAPPFQCARIVRPALFGKVLESNVVLPAPRDQLLAPAIQLGILRPNKVVRLVSDGGHQFFAEKFLDSLLSIVWGSQSLYEKNPLRGFSGLRLASMWLGRSGIARVSARSAIMILVVWGAHLQ